MASETEIPTREQHAVPLAASDISSKATIQPDEGSATEERKSVGLSFQSLKDFITKFNNDWSTTFAGTLAYSILLAIVPIMLAILATLGFLSRLVTGANQEDAILHNISQHIPGFQSQEAFIRQSLHQLSGQASLLALFAVLMAIFSGSRLFLGVASCLNIVYRVRPRPFLPQNIMAIGMMLIFILLVPIMAFAGTLPAILFNAINQYPVLTQIPFFSWVLRNEFTTRLIGFAGGLLAAFLLFAAIYIIVPNQHIRLRKSLPGALVAALAIEIFVTLVFPFYATHFMGNYTGQAGFVVILLVFFYYAAVILMLGAEVNAFFFEGVRPLPNDLGTFVSTMAGRLNRDFSPTEDTPYVDTQPTVNADKAHIASARQRSEKIQQQNQQKKQQLGDTVVRQDSEKETKGSKGKLLIEVAIGSLLAMIIQLFQMRRKKP